MLDKINATMIGSGLTAGLVILVMAVVLTGLIDNSDAVAEVRLDLTKMDVTIQNIDESVVGLNNNYEKLDEKTDKMVLILCDISNGKHCN